MENVIIRTDEENILLYFDNNKVSGYKFKKDNTIENIDESIYSYFNFIKCSNNYEKIGTEDGYEIRLDNETGFKHYYKDGIYNPKLFFYNNGENALLYKSNDNKENSSLRRFYLKKKAKMVMTISIKLFVYLFGLLNAYDKVMALCHTPLHHVDNISIEYIKDSIEESNLTNEEKNYLYNEDFFNDVLPYVNSSEFMKYSYSRSFHGINIDSFNSIILNPGDLDGYYNVFDWNTIHVRNYNFANSKDALSHEYIHLCQAPCAEYNLIVEACAEIYSYEYYSETVMNAYTEPVYLVKKLMEIIGTEAIWQYNFADDFSKIEERVKPFLTDEEYKTFLSCLSFNASTNEEAKFTTLDNLLNTLYKRIYNEDISTNEAINYLEKNDRRLVRYYFNSKYMNQENSYYINKYSVADGVKEGIIKIVVEIEEKIDQELGKKLYDEGNPNVGVVPGYCIIEDLVISKNEPIIHSVDERTDNAYSGGKVLSGHIGDYYFKEVKEKDLIEKGIIPDKIYYLKKEKTLSYDEYISGKYEKYSTKYEFDEKYSNLLLDIDINKYGPEETIPLEPVKLDPLNISLSK